MHLTHRHFPWLYPLDSLPLCFFVSKNTKKGFPPKYWNRSLFPAKIQSDHLVGLNPKIAHGPPPIGGLGPKFSTLIISFFNFFFNFFIKFIIYIKVIYNNCKFDHIYSYNNKIYLTTIIKKLKKKWKNEKINDLNFGPRALIGGGPWAILTEAGPKKKSLETSYSSSPWAEKHSSANHSWKFQLSFFSPIETP